MPSDTSPRTPYLGSCHCGRIRYVVFISLPPGVGPEQNKGYVQFEKCNCSICHKTGYLHCRLVDPTEDFYLLSPLSLPLDEDDQSGDVLTYRCNDRILHWYFCKHCGVRCFIVWGHFRPESFDLEAHGISLPETWKEKVASNLSEDGKTIQAARVHSTEEPTPAGWTEGTFDPYFSLNALTIENEQPATPDGQGLDLRVLVDKRWVEYFDALDWKEATRKDYPQRGGTW
jgi:hypothetical protein